MPRVRFSADFDFDPDHFGGRVTIAYRAGQEKTVTRECASKAVAARKGEIVDRRGADQDSERT